MPSDVRTTAMAFSPMCTGRTTSTSNSDDAPTFVQLSSVSCALRLAREIVIASSSLKAAYQWLPSQNGLLRDSPQRQSVQCSRLAPSARSTPSIPIPPRTRYGPFLETWISGVSWNESWTTPSTSYDNAPDGHLRIVSMTSSRAAPVGSIHGSTP